MSATEYEEQKSYQSIWENLEDVKHSKIKELSVFEDITAK